LAAGSDDFAFMRRCFDLAREAAARKELAFGSVIVRDGAAIAAEGNGVRAAGDITRHAEVCAIVAAQKRLGRASLDGCTLYTNVEPCAFCSYAIRETRIARVVFALGSPVMGGASRWDVLHDTGLGDAMPEVFGPPPEILGGLLAEEAEDLLKQVAPMTWAATKARGLFTVEDANRLSRSAPRPEGVVASFKALAMERLRRGFFDRFSRGAV
jgi:tRNA(adenine34) deaminase